MENSKELLKSVNEITVKNDASGTFDKIASELFNKYEIRKGDAVYDFLEIEFYYYADSNKDVIFYPRTSEAGKWFFHQSGVDITFESKCTFDYTKQSEVDRVLREGIPEGNFHGGILIRSLLKTTKGNEEKPEVITCPHKCEWDLFDAFDTFHVKEEEVPLIRKKAESVERTINKTLRKIPYNAEISKDKEKAGKKYGENLKYFESFRQSPYSYRSS
jgi:hypothetical protein